MRKKLERVVVDASGLLVFLDHVELFEQLAVLGGLRGEVLDQACPMLVSGGFSCVCVATSGPLGFSVPWRLARLSAFFSWRRALPLALIECVSASACHTNLRAFLCSRLIRWKHVKCNPEGRSWLPRREAEHRRLTISSWGL